MRLSTFIIAGIIFSAFFLGIGAFVDDMFTNYNLNLSNQKYNVSNYSRFDKIYNWTQQQYKATLNESSQVKISTLGMFVWKAPAVIATGLSSAITTFTNVLNTLTTTLGLPAWVLPVIIAIMMVVGISIIFYVILGREI